MKKGTIHSTTYQHFENLQLSAQDFYVQVQSAITVYQFPEVTCVVSALSDNGWFASRREYLQVKYHSFTYNICAAPFGKNFFFSWRLQEYVSWWTRFSRWAEGRREKSFYELDTEAMFSDSITSIVTALIEKIAQDHGFRESETIPA